MAEAEQGGGWRPIETAPRDGTKVLGGWWFQKSTTRRDWVVATLKFAPKGRWVSVPGAWEYDPTHWAPIPSPPGSTEETT
jgi:hypothetical protein